MMRSKLLVAIAATAVLLAPSARADSDAQATAELLFQQGKAAMAAGNTGEACPKFEESYRLDKAGGTLQNLAFCYESAGRWASAYARYQELLAMSKAATPPRPDRVQLAEEHIKKLSTFLTRLVITVLKDAQTPGIVVKVRAVEYKEIAWSSGIVLDPGPYEVEISAPGKKPTRVNVVMDERKDAAIIIPKLEDLPAPKGDAAKVDPHPTRTLGLIVGASGIAVLATGGVFGGLMLQSRHEATATCANSACTNDTAGLARLTTSHGQSNDARTFATVADVLLPVGAVALGAGAYLFFRGPQERAARSARLVPTLGGAMVEGTF
jgi:hypothetical protein